jgi:nucleoside-diphosphate-sugar epimerase
VSKIFVTGGSGFIGGRLIARLRSEGHQVRALARSTTAAERVRAHGAELAYWVSAQECRIRIDKAREQLGYTPVKTIADGLAELGAAPAPGRAAAV